MKNNTFKRVLAGSLALLTVAAYVPANVGGILATNGVSLTAVAADEVRVSWEATDELKAIGEYITSISDGTKTINTDTTKNTDSYKFAENKTLTVVSSIPLSFTKTGVTTMAKSDDATLNLEAKESGTYTNEDKYIESESNGVYTYKVLNNKQLAFAGIDSNVTIYNQTDAVGSGSIVLGDGNKVELKAVDDPITVGNTQLTFSGGSTQETLVQKSVAKIYATKAFEAYVRVDGVQNIDKVVATYDSTTGKFVANATIPVTTGSQTVSIYLNKVTPNYAYTNNGTELLATADNAPQVTAASIKATYQNKVRTTVEERETNGDKEYKYDTVTEMTSGAQVANASRVELTFTNDTTQEITTHSADSDTTFYTLKITRDGKELTKANTATPPVTGDYVWQDGDPTTDNAPTDGQYGVAGVTVSGADYFVPDASGNIKHGEGKLAFTQTGKYVVEYTVYTKTVTNGSTTLKPETLKYEFTIKAKEDLTAENVKLTASGNNLKGAAKDTVGTINKAAIVNGVVEFEVSENWTTSDVITVNPTIFAETDFALTDSSSFDAGAVNPDGTPKSIIGTQRSSTLDQVNTMTVVYDNPEFGSQDKTITIKWKLVEAKKQAVVSEDEVYAKEHEDAKFDNDPYFRTTEDKIDTIEEDLRATLSIKNAEPEEISFEYVEGFDASTETEELDYHEPGLPKTEGKYTVYAVWEGETVAWFNVQIIKHALYAAPTAEQLDYTYGEKIPTSNDLAFEDVDGNPVDAGVKGASITYMTTKELTAYQSKKITADGKYNNLTVFTVDGKNYVADKEVLTDSAATISDGQTKVAVTDYLDAGLYVMTVAPAVGTTIENKDYALETKEFAVNVAKKEITSDMITFKAQNYNSGKYISAPTPTITDVDVKDAADNAINIAGVISDGTTSASAIGAYSVKVQVDATGTNGKNYTGKVSADWHIVKKANNEAMQGLAFVDKETTIYNNGQIHFEITRPADTQFKNGVAQYGVVFDKSGKIAAPTKNSADWGKAYDQLNGNYPRQGKGSKSGTTFTYQDSAAGGFKAAAEFTAATAALQVGNGYTEGKQSAKLKAENPTKYGANVNVKDVETGAWFRPYVIDGEGNIYYGKVVYINLVQEATDALNLNISNRAEDTVIENVPLSGGGTKVVTYANTKVVSKDDAKKDQSAKVLAEKSWRAQVRSGYDTKKNAYYVYGSYTLAEDSNVKTDAVKGFGVVVDKKGVFSAADGTANAGKTADGKTTVADGLKLGKGFIEGKSGSNKMDVDEYGALISPYNSVTGVWVRAYVDLGNDLVVYTPPIYIKDVSSIYNADEDYGLGLYAETMGPQLLTKSRFDDKVLEVGNALLPKSNDWFMTKSGLAAYVKDIQKIRIGFKSGSINGVAPTSAGVIVDKTGSFLTKDPATGKYIIPTVEKDGKFVVSKPGAAKLADAKAKMLIGNGYVQGKKAPNAEGFYFANVTPDTYRPTASAAEENIPIVVRPYAIYEINGKEVVVYGDPTVTQVNNLSDFQAQS